MLTLGINAAFHDSAACLVQDGNVIAAVEEERFTHIKHAKRPVPFSVWELPFNAISYCLSVASADVSSLDHIAYSFDPAVLLGQRIGDEKIELPLEPSSKGHHNGFISPWDPLMLSYVVNAPRQFAAGAPHHIADRFNECERNYRWHFVNHHIAHAASAFLPSPFNHAAVVALDGRGEAATTSYYSGVKQSLQLLGSVNMPHSLGLLYEEVTDYLGFLRSSDEYKVMALASFGQPVYKRDFEELVELLSEGRYLIHPLHLVERFGPARKRGGPYEKRHYDIASSLQVVLEERVLELARWVHSKTAAENLCLAGGVALNCVMNSRIRDRGPFKALWVQPAAGDAGTALGAALWVDAQEQPPKERWRMEHAYLGPEYEDREIENFLRWTKVPYKKMANVAEETAEVLAQNKIVGWFQGRMEFGPRALGARSILASAIPQDMQDRLNEIKDREDFRPVAPVVLEEKAHEWFEGSHAAPFMLFIFNVRPEKAGQIPAVRHVDGTARVQTINRKQNVLYYDLIEAFERRTGVPVLVNTSFNTRGEPIVCTPRDAVECFWTSPLDALVIGSFLLLKPSKKEELRPQDD